MKEKVKVKWSVMSVTVVLFIIMLGAILINAEKFYDILYNLVMNNAMWGLGWFSSLVCLAMVIFCIVVMVTPLGKVKLGGPNAKPKFTMMQWFGISLCTGIGAGGAADLCHGAPGVYRFGGRQQRGCPLEHGALLHAVGPDALCHLRGHRRHPGLSDPEQAGTLPDQHDADPDFRKRCDSQQMGQRL